MKNLLVIGLAFLAVGFWCNMTALNAFIQGDQAILAILGDVLPFEFSIGDCLVFIGYGMLVFLLGESLFIVVSRKIRERR